MNAEKLIEKIIDLNGNSKEMDKWVNENMEDMEN